VTRDLTTALADLDKLVQECATPDWDAHGATPAHGSAARRAARLLRVLPAGLPAPEIGPEPDGSISLDWMCSRQKLLSVSVGTGDRLACAWVAGSHRGHEVVRFDGKLAPQRLLRCLEKIAFT